MRVVKNYLYWWCPVRNMPQGSAIEGGRLQKEAEGVISCTVRMGRERLVSMGVQLTVSSHSLMSIVFYWTGCEKMARLSTIYTQAFHKPSLPLLWRQPCPAHLHRFWQGRALALSINIEEQSTGKPSLITRWLEHFMKLFGSEYMSLLFSVNKPSVDADGQGYQSI